MTAPSETPIIGWVMQGSSPMGGDEIQLVLVADKSVLRGWGDADAGFDGMAFQYEMHLSSVVAEAFALAHTQELEDTGYDMQIPPHAVTLSNSSRLVAAELSEVPKLRRKIISTLFLDGKRLTPYS